jgi:hypothetical protein
LNRSRQRGRMPVPGNRRAGRKQHAAGRRPRGDALLSKGEVTATVTKIDHKSREVALKTKDGGETTFIAEPAVRSLTRVNRGDVVTATYTEALACEVKRGGKPGADMTTAAALAASRARPDGVIGRKTTVTVLVD